MEIESSRDPVECRAGGVNALLVQLTRYYPSSLSISVSLLLYPRPPSHLPGAGRGRLAITDGWTSPQQTTDFSFDLRSSVEWLPRGAL